MHRKKLAKLRSELDSLRRSQATAKTLRSLAKRLGRLKADRGKHPMWESREFPKLTALAIPDHGGRDLATGTKHIILDNLEKDVQAWDEKIAERERNNGGGEKNGD